MNVDTVESWTFLMACVLLLASRWQLSRAERKIEELRATGDQLNDALGKANAGNATLIKIAEHWKAKAGIKRIIHGKN
jgi:hypothetical protein